VDGMGGTECDTRIKKEQLPGSLATAYPCLLCAGTGTECYGLIERAGGALDPVCRSRECTIFLHATKAVLRAPSFAPQGNL
jgi:hypothetical protein